MTDTPTFPYYKFRVKKSFTTAGVIFIPGRDYYVAPAIFDSTITDGSKFSDHCIDPIPFYGKP